MDVLLPHPVVAEIAYGIARLPRSKRQRLLEERFGAITGTFRAKSNGPNEVSTAFGEIKALLERRKRRIEDFDAAIAAHAIANEATLVSANSENMELAFRGLCSRTGSARNDVAAQRNSTNTVAQPFKFLQGGFQVQIARFSSLQRTAFSCEAPEPGARRRST